MNNHKIGVDISGYVVDSRAVYPTHSQHKLLHVEAKPSITKIFLYDSPQYTIHCLPICWCMHSVSPGINVTDYSLCLCPLPIASIPSQIFLTM